MYIFFIGSGFKFFDHQAPGVLEQEHPVVPPSNNDSVMGEGEPQSNEAEPKGKKKRVRKKKTTTSEEEPEKKKKFKHSSRRQKNRTCTLSC